MPLPLSIEQHPLPAGEGVVLHTRFARHAAPGAAAATVVITHGLGEHSGRYGHVVECMTAVGCEVMTYDLRGHGRSTGRRGDGPGFHAFLDDLQRVIARARELSSLAAAPLFLYGHSLGGLITLRFLQEQAGRGGISGAVAASPWLRLAFTPPRWKLLLAEVARRVWPSLRQITGMDTSRLSRDPAFLATLPDLHLAHHRLSARLFYGILQSAIQAREHAPEVTTPLLLLHGQRDPVTSWAATREFYEAADSPDKTLLLYPETFHETHNDLDRKQVLGDIAAWLQKRAPDPR